MKDETKALIILICDKILDEESSLSAHEIREMLYDAIETTKE